MPAEQDYDPEATPAAPWNVHTTLATVAGTEPVVRSLERDALGSRPRPVRVGQYRVIEELGRGGMGVVYLAETSWGRRVALKMVTSALESLQVLARFRQESQILAMMRHPNIADVYDVGVTSDGGAYFAMEHIAGDAITTFADEHRLDVRQRVELFIPVCDAAEHAHAKGIVHRDLKPSNILVKSNGKPIPIVIDFGVAKSLPGSLAPPEAEVLQADRWAGTRGYMSPEQLRGDADIDPRADIFSMGVVLYELLTGARPWAVDELSLDRLRRSVTETIPTRPSRCLLESIAAGSRRSRGFTPVPNAWTVSRQLREDLDFTIMKCLHPDRRKRYDSAAALRDDLVRYLHGLPVFAHPPTIRYRLIKFTRRRRWQLATILLSALLLATVVGVWPAVVAPAVVALIAFAVGLAVGLPDYASAAASPVPTLRMAIASIVGMVIMLTVPQIVNSQDSSLPDVQALIGQSSFHAQIIAPTDPTVRRSLDATLGCTLSHPGEVLLKEAFRLSAAITVSPKGGPSSASADQSLVATRILGTQAVSMTLSLAGADVAPTGANRTASDRAFWWSVSAANCGQQAGFLTAEIDSTRLNPPNSTDPIVLASMEQDRIPFTITVRDRTKDWLTWLGLYAGGAIVLAQVTAALYKGYCFLAERWRLAKIRRAPKIIRDV